MTARQNGLFIGNNGLERTIKHVISRSPHKTGAVSDCSIRCLTSYATRKIQSNAMGASPAHRIDLSAKLTLPGNARAAVDARAVARQPPRPGRAQRFSTRRGVDGIDSSRPFTFCNTPACFASAARNSAISAPCSSTLRCSLIVTSR